MVTELLITALFGTGLFGVFGVLAWLADRPTRTEYPDRWTD